MIHLLHGAAGSPEDWDGFRSLLGEHPSRVVDLYAGEILPFDPMAEAINASAELGDILIGYSMGGRLALHALVAPRSPWSRAVIVSADPGGGLDSERVRRDAEWAALARSDWPRFCREWAAQPVFGGASMPWDRGDVAERRREAIARAFEEWTVGKQRDLRAELSELSIPVLWIVGERDAKFVRLAEGVMSTIRDGQLEVIAGTGHRAPWEQPESVAGAIRSFLS